MQSGGCREACKAVFLKHEATSCFSIGNRRGFAVRAVSDGVRARFQLARVNSLGLEVV